MAFPPVKSSTEAVSEVIKGAPPMVVTSASFLGLAFQEWVYVLTAVYTLIQILRLMPKIYGCGVCFYRHGLSCKRTCKMG